MRRAKAEIQGPPTAREQHNADGGNRQLLGIEGKRKQRDDPEHLGKAVVRSEIRAGRSIGHERHLRATGRGEQTKRIDVD
jgi:hypothetical protein